MLLFALDGITSFSVSPIRFVTSLGFLSLILSSIAGGYALIQEILGHTQSGWTSLILSIWYVGGLQLLGIGIIGSILVKYTMRLKIVQDMLLKLIYSLTIK